MIATDDDRERLQATDIVDAQVVARLILHPEVADETARLLAAFMAQHFVRVEADVEDDADGTD